MLFLLRSSTSLTLQDVPPFHVVAGNPARIIRKIETVMDAAQQVTSIPANPTVGEGVEEVLAKE